MPPDASSKPRSFPIPARVIVGCWAGCPAGCEGSRAQRSLVLLVGMLGHPGWSWTVVADDGVPITVRPAEVHVCLATRRLSLSLAVGVRVASTWVDPPRRWREDKYTTVGTVKWFNADK